MRKVLKLGEFHARVPGKAATKAGIGSAPTLKNWMTLLVSVAVLEKG
jgi:hypothetical protein